MLNPFFARSSASPDAKQLLDLANSACPRPAPQPQQHLSADQIARYEFSAHTHGDI